MNDKKLEEYEFLLDNYRLVSRYTESLEVLKYLQNQIEYIENKLKVNEKYKNYIDGR